MQVMAIWWWRCKIAYGGENGGEQTWLRVGIFLCF
jgi:hypothetical protein